jgi:hypothetical protein
VIDHPDVHAELRNAPAALLQVLSRRVDPLLRSDPTDVGGRHAGTWQPPWFVSKAEFPEGVAVLAHQVLKDQLLVMTRRLLWAPVGTDDPEPPTGPACTERTKSPTYQTRQR